MSRTLLPNNIVRRTAKKLPECGTKTFNFVAEVLEYFVAVCIYYIALINPALDKPLAQL